MLEETMLPLLCIIFLLMIDVCYFRGNLGKTV